MNRTIYKGVDIQVYEKSILIGGTSFYFERRVEERDIFAVKSIIDAGRRALSREIIAAQDQLTLLIKDSR